MTRSDSDAECRELAAALRWALHYVRYEPRGLYVPARAAKFNAALERARDILDDARDRQVYGAGGAAADVGPAGDCSGEGPPAPTHECEECEGAGGFVVHWPTGPSSTAVCGECKGTGRVPA